MGAQRIDRDLLADQVARRLDRTVLLHEVAVVGVGVGAVIADHRLYRRFRCDQLEDRPIERATDVDVTGNQGLNILRPADGVADHLSLSGAR